MKKILIPTLTAVILFSPAVPVFAIDGSPSPSTAPRAQFRQYVQQANQTFKTDVEQAREERKTNITQARLGMIEGVAKKHASRLQNQFAVHARWLGSIATRLQARINTLKSEGVDVTAMQNELNAAEAAITTATTDGTNAVNAFNGITGTTLEEVRAAVQNAITLAQQTRAAFNNAKQLLVQTFQMVRSATPRPSESPEASPSV